MRKHFIAFGGFFAECGVLLTRNVIPLSKHADTFNAKNPREIAPGVFFVPKIQKVAKKLKQDLL